MGNLKVVNYEYRKWAGSSKARKIFGFSEPNIIIKVRGVDIEGVDKVEIAGYKYNPKVGNYCRRGMFGFVKPYEALRVRDMPEEEMQKVVYTVKFLRSGEIDWKAMDDREHAKYVAQDIGIW